MGNSQYKAIIYWPVHIKDRWYLVNYEVKHVCAHTPVQQLESLPQAGRCFYGVRGWWPQLPRATMGAEMLLPFTPSALMDQAQPGSS